MNVRHGLISNSAKVRVVYFVSKLLFEKFSAGRNLVPGSARPNFFFLDASVKEYLEEKASRIFLKFSCIC